MGDLRSFAGGGGDGSVGDKSGIMVTFVEYLVRVVEVELVVVLEQIGYHGNKFDTCGRVGMVGG